MQAFDLSRTLQRAQGVKVVLRSADSVRVTLGDQEVSSGPHALAVLDAFSRPMQASVALKALEQRARGVPDWIDLMNTVIRFFQEGVLVDEQAAAPPEVGSETYSFDRPEVHIAMLNDRVRSEAFLRAIRETVTPDDVVVDIGTGTGVLAMAAAQAGARHVYAVEAGEIGRAARELISANGLADRVTVVSGWSTRVELPERGTVLIGELIGNEPLGENILKVFVDARKRLLQPGARFIPARMRVLGLPVAVPKRESGAARFDPGDLQNWREWYGIDFSQLQRLPRRGQPALSIKPQKAREWEILGDPVLLHELDFGQVPDGEICSTATGQVQRPGGLDGILVYFELELSPGVSFSTHPACADENNHWRSIVWLLPEAISLEPGDKYAVQYAPKGPRDHQPVCVRKL